MIILVILIHLFVDFLFGLPFLRTGSSSRIDIFTIVKATAFGMFFETISLSIFHYFDGTIKIGFLIFAVIGIAHFLYDFKIKKYKWKWEESLFKNKYSIWEIGLIVIIVEKFIWGIVNIWNQPIYFDDTFNHWSGRGKALLHNINWSWDPESVYFLGKAFGHLEYPLFASFWRASNIAFIGHRSDIAERIDGAIMLLFVIITTIALVHQFTNKRWAGLMTAAIISMIPLEAWHIIAGYTDVYIQAYLLLAIWSVFNHKYILAGIFTAAAVWSKNEGLIIYMPAIVMCLTLHLLLDDQSAFRKKVRDFLKFNLAWILPILPWLIFKIYNNVGFTIPSKKGIGYVDDSMNKMVKVLFDSPSSSILWITLFIGMTLSIPNVLRFKKLQILNITSLTLLAIMTFVFTCTGASIFLENEMTIHRSLLQISPIFIITVVASLTVQKNN